MGKVEGNRGKKEAINVSSSGENDQFVFCEKWALASTSSSSPCVEEFLYFCHRLYFLSSVWALSPCEPVQTWQHKTGQLHDLHGPPCNSVCWSLGPFPTRPEAPAASDAEPVEEPSVLCPSFQGQNFRAALQQILAAPQRNPSRHSTSTAGWSGQQVQNWWNKLTWSDHIKLHCEAELEGSE